MRGPPTGASCFDASALVKVFTSEHGGVAVREFFQSGSLTKYATPFCFYESMNVLKSKWFYRKELTHEQYNDAAFKLMAWFGSLTQYPDLDFGNPLVFGEVRSVAAKHALDWSDAFQIVSVRQGFFAPLVNDSQTLLVTADRRLAEVARSEGLRAWSCVEEPHP